MKNELETLGDLLTEFQLVKVLLAGATGEPGLLQRVEESRPVIERLTELLGQLREVSETDTQAVANLAARLDGIVETFEGFEKRVGRLVSGTFSDAFLAEQGQRLVIEVSQLLAKQSAQSAIDQALAVITEELDDAAQKIADSKLAKHHVTQVASLTATLTAVTLERDRAREELGALKRFHKKDALLWAISSGLMCAMIAGSAVFSTMQNLAQ